MAGVTQNIVAIIPANGWNAVNAAEIVHLAHDARTRRRAVYELSGGESALLNMPNVVRLRDGDGLQLEDGRIVRVEAAPEPLLEITAPNLSALVQIAWHLGNRHLETQLLDGALRIRDDHVIAGMVEILGGACKAIMAPFDPEGGAYESGTPAHGHTHHGHGHAHHHHHG